MEQGSEDLPKMIKKFKSLEERERKKTFSKPQKDSQGEKNIAGFGFG